jgi:hypothetical protein
MGTFYFFGFIGSLQHMMSQASTQPQTVSTETTSPQARQANLLPFVTAFFFGGVVFFAGAVFLVFVAKALPPLLLCYYRLVIASSAKQSCLFLDCFVGRYDLLAMTFHLSVFISFFQTIRT